MKWGNIHQRGAFIEIRYTVNGERLHYTMPRGSTMREAEAMRVELRYSVLHGTHIRPSTSTFGQLLDEWLASDHEWSNNSRLSCRDSSRRLAQAEVAPGLPLGSLRVRDLRLPHVEAAKQSLRAAYSPRTVNLALECGKMACAWAIKLKLLGDNYFTEVKRLTPARAERRALKPDDAMRLFSACLTADWDNPFAMFVAFGMTSLRRYNEATGLFWSDADLVQGTYTVRRGWDDNAHEFMANENDKHKYRSYQLAPAAVRVLEQQRKRIAHIKARAESLRITWPDNDLVFPSRTGQPLPKSSLDQALTALCEAAGVERLRVHELRHTGVSLLIGLGCSKWQIMEIGGWSSLAQVEATYGHLFTEDVQAALAKFSTIFEGVG